MNSNGFTKRNIFIGDVQITEDLTCGDMICQEMTLTGDINLDNKDIIGVNNLEVKTVNGDAILTNPLTSSFDADGNSIINNPEIDGLIQKTQYITAVEEFQETQFSAGILVNGLISNASEVVFANGSTITGTDADLVINSAGIGNISSTSNITTTADMTCTTINADAINVPAVTTLETKTQYQSVNTTLNSTIFNGIVNPTLTLSIGNAQPNATGYNLPSARPLTAGYVMTTPNATGNTLTFTLASDPAKVQNLTASTGQSTFAGILNVNSDLKINGLSTLVGGILSNQKITLTKNIIEIEEDNIYTESIVIGNLLTTGYSLPRTTNSIVGSDLRLLSNKKLSFFGPGSIRSYRVDTVPDFNTLTFANANVNVNLSGYLTTQNITNGSFSWQATGARYEGALTRNFIGDFSVILLNENKDIVPNITLELTNISSSIDYSTQIFEHTHNRSRQWVLQATGTVSQNQIISARIRSSIAGSSTTIGSPQLNITLL